ncbi:MAG: hypothetical protein MI724_05570 [Spirochaetales bacterium]|nr:hypothetical protein [Spirochaetales bacterium]
MPKLSVDLSIDDLAQTIAHLSEEERETLAILDFFDPAEQSEFVDVDVRWLKKINELRQLPEAEQKEIARHITSVAEKVRLREQLQDVNRDSS